MCFAGFKGNGFQCDDIDECINTTICKSAGEHMTCKNTQGSYECHCMAEYFRNSDDGKCTDKNQQVVIVNSDDIIIRNVPDNVVKITYTKGLKRVYIEDNAAGSDITLQLSYDPDEYKPQDGDSIEIFQYLNHTGDFDTIMLTGNTDDCVDADIKKKRRNNGMFLITTLTLMVKNTCAGMAIHNIIVNYNLLLFTTLLSLHNIFKYLLRY
jgi:hypothetical protein